MKWCCMGFHGHCEEAGRRGTGIFVSTLDASDSVFILQFRALDPGAKVPHTESPLSIVMDLQIQFCPWCGANLRKRYRDHLRDLERSELRII